jgi:hypothetical protein
MKRILDGFLLGVGFSAASLIVFWAASKALEWQYYGNGPSAPPVQSTHVIQDTVATAKPAAKEALNDLISMFGEDMRKMHQELIELRTRVELCQMCDNQNVGRGREEVK